MHVSETGAASSTSARGLGERLVCAGGLAAIVAGGGGCSAMLGYDDITYEDGETTRSAHDPDCDPEQVKGAIDDACGAFASAANGDDLGGDGTKLHPFRTLGRALGTGKTVYACNDAAFEEAITVEADAVLFGGLDCAHGWVPAPMKRTAWRGVPGVPALRVGELARAELHDLSIVAPDAVNPGDSSIGVLADAMSTLELKHAAISAGRGADAPPAQLPAMAGMQGAPGGKGTDGCTGSSSATDPGTGGAGVCEGGDVSGGAGGPGLAGTSGADGSDGSPTPESGDEGRGGKKQDLTLCESGEGGAKGSPGADGAGAKSLGTLGATGWIGAVGDDGARGGSGQGGGGGGGGKQCLNAKAGPAGGGGGAGGCGGIGGRGGRAGGASIGIASLNAKLLLSDVLISAGDGGKGGDGAVGGPGGSGGLAGSGGQGDAVAKACSGGRGGDGGKGGRGGGGSGGPSIGIAYHGSPPPAEGVEILLGKAGDGGKGGGPSGEGAPGLAIKTQAIP